MLIDAPIKTISRPSLFIKEVFIDRDRDHAYASCDWYRTVYKTRAQLFQALVRRFGRCIGKFYSQIPGCKRQIAGWCFEKVVPYANAQKLPLNARSYKREAWVEVLGSAG